MVRLENVTKRFAVRGGYNYVARNLTFTFPAGKSVGLLGRNGAGKSTMLQMIAGLVQPTSGEINIERGSTGSIPPSWWISCVIFPNWAGSSLNPCAPIPRACGRGWPLACRWASILTPIWWMKSQPRHRRGAARMRCGGRAGGGGPALLPRCGRRHRPAPPQHAPPF